MKIIRNGVEIELTLSELCQAHNECAKIHMKEDILSKLIEKRDEGFNNEIMLDLIKDLESNVNTSIVERVDKALSKNDGYYESYWCTIDYVLDEIIKEKNKGE